MTNAHAEIADPTTCKMEVPSTGDVVELRRRGATFRTGSVEAVMPDGTGFWLASHGLDTRIYVPSNENDMEVLILTATEPATLGAASEPAPATR